MNSYKQFINRQKPQNYHSVALIYYLTDALKRLAEYLEVNNQCNTNECGFRAGNSCLLQLLDQQGSSHHLSRDTKCKGGKQTYHSNLGN